MPHVDVPGAELYYETDGHSSAPALLLIHAGVANLRMWDPLVATLADRHYVVRYDTRGFGQTSADDVPFSDRDDAYHLLAHLGVPSATLIGCSRGGGIAIDIALESPERVSGLVTIGSGPSGFPDTELTDAEDAFVDPIDEAFAAGDWPRVNRMLVQLWSIGVERDEKSLDPAFVRTAYELNRPNLAHAGHKRVSTPLDPPAFDRVCDIDVPTLFTVGEFDLSEALTQQAYLVDAVPGAEGYIFSETAHLPSVEHPDEFLDVLTDWLARHEL